MSITAETAKHHANDPAVFCCRAEEPAPAVSGSVAGVGTYVSGGKVVLSIKEGKDIYIELPI